MISLSLRIVKLIFRSVIGQEYALNNGETQLESNTVFVGNKPVMTYVLSVISRVNSGGNEVTLKARGRAITTAVDVAQIAKRRFMNSLQIDDVKIDTEEVETREGGKRSVSSIEIRLKNEGTAPPKSSEAASEAAPASETGTTT